ncbi:MAG: UPF0179 family protein [Candidatus Odinarchaeia archaeon]
MGILTLIGEKQAKVGNKFILNSISDECVKCKLKQVCVDNLEKGRIYEIINVRGDRHKCSLFEGDTVVVEVKLAPITALINSRICFEGATITFNPVDCNNFQCKNRKYCNPVGLKKGDKCKIIKILNKEKGEICPEKRGLKLVQLELLPPTG